VASIGKRSLITVLGGGIDLVPLVWSRIKRAMAGEGRRSTYFVRGGSGNLDGTLGALAWA